MTTCNFKLCDNFRISRLIFNCNGRRNTEDLEFHLLNQDEKKYSFSNILPESNNYLYLKIDKNGKVISIEGDYMKKFKLKRQKIIKKYLEEIDTVPQFFIDFVKPLQEMSIEKGEAYQFLFNSNHDENPLVCSLYPCSIPGHVSSVDVVVRQPQDIIERDRMNNFILKSNGQKIPIINNN